MAHISSIATAIKQQARGHHWQISFSDDSGYYSDDYNSSSSSSGSHNSASVLSGEGSLFPRSLFEQPLLDSYYANALFFYPPQQTVHREFCSSSRRNGIRIAVDAASHPLKTLHRSGKGSSGRRPTNFKPDGLVSSTHSCSPCHKHRRLSPSHAAAVLSGANFTEDEMKLLHVNLDTFRSNQTRTHERLVANSSSYRILAVELNMVRSQKISHPLRGRLYSYKKPRKGVGTRSSLRQEWPKVEGDRQVTEQ